jgi:ubiquinone/menaquinone biosynthesis C-methylase UbiE
MASGFDTAASNYDTSFTNSVIGKLQRGYVYNHLSAILREARPEKILEINCGTGEDAIWLSRQDYKVTATDISETMIMIAQSKSQCGNPVFKQVDINELPSHFKEERFDLIFSNFGGLNCLSEIQLEFFFKNTSQLLTPRGMLALVIMPKNTLWEQFYFLVKANFKNITRRKKGSLIANVDGESIITYYYNPKEAATLADYYYHFRNVHPIGFFVPPSYLEPFFKNKKRLVSALDKLEAKVQRRKRLSKYADHYLIVFEKR